MLKSRRAATGDADRVLVSILLIIVRSPVFLFHPPPAPPVNTQFNSEAREAFAETAFDASISIVVDRLRESGELDLVECDLFVDIRIGDERKTVAVNYLRYVDDDSFRMDYSDTQPDPRYADRVDYVELERIAGREGYIVVGSGEYRSSSLTLSDMSNIVEALRMTADGAER